MTLYVYMFNKFPIKFESELEIENQLKNGDQIRQTILQDFADLNITEELLDLLKKIFSVNP